MTDHPTVKVARDLTEIARLYGDLRAYLSAGANSRLMPGGRIMAQLGPVANVEAWAWMHDATERTGDPYTSVVDEDPDESWSAWQLISYWSTAWRHERDEEYDIIGGNTIATEAAYIRACLDWAWDNEIHWDDFARDINNARKRLEDDESAGKRQELTRIVCDRMSPDHRDDQRPPRLIRLYGAADDGSDDRWKCPGCKIRMTLAEVSAAHAKMLRSEGADKWVHQADAIGTLKAQGRPERTVRQWLADLEAEAYCDPVTHAVYVWWPSLWRKHLATPMRKRGATA